MVKSVALYRARHRGAEGAGIPLAWSEVLRDVEMDAARDEIAADGDGFMHRTVDAAGTMEAWASLDGEAVMLRRFVWEGIEAPMAGWARSRDAVNVWETCPVASWLLYAAPQIASTEKVTSVVCEVIRAVLSGPQKVVAPWQRSALDDVATLDGWVRGEAPFDAVLEIERRWDGRMLASADSPLAGAMYYAARVVRTIRDRSSMVTGTAAYWSVESIVKHSGASDSVALADMVRGIITPDTVFTARVMTATIIRTIDGVLE